MQQIFCDQEIQTGIAKDKARSAWKLKHKGRPISFFVDEILLVLNTWRYQFRFASLYGRSIADPG